MSRFRTAFFALLFAGASAVVTAQAPPTAKSPDPKTPEVKTPETKAPEAKAPEKAPETKAPDAKAPETKAPEAKAPAAGDKQSFSLTLEKGKPFYEEMTTTVSQQIKVQGQDLNQKQEQGFVFEWTPEKQDGDRWTLKQKVVGVKMKIDISNNPIEYDSSNKNTAGAAGNPGLTDFFKNLEGSEFTVILNTKDNKVEKVEGKDEFVKKLAGGNTQLEGLLKKILTDEAVKQMTDPTFGLLPASPKAVNESWESKSSLNLGPIGSYDVTYKFTYKAKDKDEDKIEVVPTLTYKAPTDTADGLLFRIKGGDLKSTSTTPGVIKYNPKTGRITEANIKIELQGTLQVTIGGTDTTVELRQSQETTIKMSDKNPIAEKKTP